MGRTEDELDTHFPLLVHQIPNRLRRREAGKEGGDSAGCSRHHSHVRRRERSRAEGARAFSLSFLSNSARISSRVRRCGPSSIPAFRPSHPYVS